MAWRSEYHNKRSGNPYQIAPNDVRVFDEMSYGDVYDATNWIAIEFEDRYRYRFDENRISSKTKAWGLEGPVYGYVQLGVKIELTEDPSSLSKPQDLRVTFNTTHKARADVFTLGSATSQCYIFICHDNSIDWPTNDDANMLSTQDTFDGTSTIATGPSDEEANEVHSLEVSNTKLEKGDVLRLAIGTNTVVNTDYFGYGVADIAQEDESTTGPHKHFFQLNEMTLDWVDPPPDTE